MSLKPPKPPPQPSPKNEIKPPAEANAEADAPAATPARKASLENLGRLLIHYDHLQTVLSDTNALKPKLEGEIAATLATGDVANESFANSLSTKRGQVELIPAKVAQLEVEIAAKMKEIEAEFNLCYIALDHRFKGAYEVMQKHIDAFIRPLLSDDFMVAFHAESLVPHTKLNRSIGGLISYVRQPIAQNNWPEAARQLIRRQGEADRIMAEVKAIKDLAA